MGTLRAPLCLRQGCITEAGLLSRVEVGVEAVPGLRVEAGAGDEVGVYAVPGLRVEGGAGDEALQGHDGGPQLEHVRGQLLGPAPRMRTTRGHGRLKCHKS